MKQISNNDVRKKLDELHKQSLKENPVVMNGEGTKLSPALKGLEQALKIFLPRINSFERRV